MTLPIGKKYAMALLALLIFLCTLLIHFVLFLSFAPGKGTNIKLFDFEQGSSLKKIASELEQGGMISSARMFVIYARLSGTQSKIQAGYYQFTDGLRPGEVLRKMVAGEVYAKKFSVPEGYSIYQISELLESQGLFKKEPFLRLCGSKTLLKELNITGNSVEGYLYPCTYNVSPKDDEEALIRTMVEQFEKIYGQRFADRVKTHKLGKHEIVTLASIIDKEAVAPAERPLIASVFLNRLDKGMPLQSDPTAVYGLRAFGGSVSKEDVNRKTPYNTYVIKGLPPGPIGNPSSEAIDAVLSPVKTDYLYFVAKKDGTHAFSKTLDQHNNAVRTFLKGR